MADLSGFNADEIEPNMGFEPIPEGDYVAMIVDSEFKATNNKEGEYLQLTEEIIDGPHRGRRLFDRLNLKNKNDTAVKIAQGTLSAVCRAVNVLRPKDSAELHGKPLRISVGVEERNDKPGQFSNKIRSYKSVSDAPAAAAPASATAEKTPPWKRKSA